MERPQHPVLVGAQRATTLQHDRGLHVLACGRHPHPLRSAFLTAGDGRNTGGDRASADCYGGFPRGQASPERAQRSMPASTACSSIAASSASLKCELVQRVERVVELLDVARADQRRGDALVAQHPRERHLRERLAARLGDLVERADVLEVLVAQQVRRQRGCPGPPASPSGSRRGTCSVSRPCASGEKAMQPTPSLLQHVEQALLDPAVEHGVRRLVDQQRRAQLASRIARGLAGALGL